MTAADPPAGTFQSDHSKILLVEPDDFDREYLTNVLQPKHQVLHAGDEASALRIIDEHDVDVVIVDSGLPGGAGDQVLRQCRDRRPGTSRILLSGILDLETIIRSVNDGHIFACIPKPVDPNTLLTTVHNASRACRFIRERSSLIEELAEANAKTQREQKQLVAINAELRTLITIATHDLREPLRSTRFFLDKSIQQLGESTNPAIFKHLSRVRRAHDRMDELLLGLREWLRLQTGEFPMEPVDIAVVVEEVLDSLARLLSDRQVKLQVPPNWPKVEANAPLLRSVFENLISNAVRFSPEGPPEVALSWEFIQVNDEKRARFSVKDAGIGIDPAYHEQVFGMFKRLESRQQFEGTGAGLAICNKIMQRHGGQIGVDSVRGQGASFWFTLRAA